MTTFDTDVFGAAGGGSGGGGTGVVKYRPGLMVEYGDEVKSLKDLEVYVRWSKTPEVLTLSVDPADDYMNFKSSTGLCPVGGTTSYIKEDAGNITKNLVRYKGCLYVYNTSSLNDTIDLTNTIYDGAVDEKFIQKLPGDVNSGRALAGDSYVLSSVAVGDVTPGKNVVFYSNTTSANGSNLAIPKNGFYKANGSSLQLLKEETTALTLQLLVSVDENTHFFFDGNYGISRVYVTTDNFATRSTLNVDKSLYYAIGSVRILSFVKSTDGRYFLTTGGSTGSGSSTAPDTTVLTTILAAPFFYELKFNNDYTTASLIPIYQPLTVADSSSACIEGQVSLLSLKDNKLAVLFSCDQVYIYDINTGTFLEINSQAKKPSGSDLNSTNYRTVNQKRMGYDHVNNKLYVATGTLWQVHEIKYIIYDLVKGVKQQLTLSRGDAKHNSSYYYFDSMFFKDGSFFGRSDLNSNYINKSDASLNLSYQIVNSCFMYAIGSPNNQYVKSFVLISGLTGFSNLYITKFGHRYDDFIYSLNNLREMTTSQRHMNYNFTDYIYYGSSPATVLEQYMFRIF